MSIEPTLSDVRLVRRREHLMREITLLRPVGSAETAPRQRHRSRRFTVRRSLVGGLITACAVAVVVGTLIDGPGEQGGPDAFEIRRISNETVSVRIVNTSVAADRMSEQLHEQGLDVTIEAMPASPQLVGAWLTLSLSQDVSPAAERSIEEQFTNGYVSAIQLPARFTGRIWIGVGVAPGPRQDLQVSGIRNALAPNAWLGCLHATGGEPATVRRAAEFWGYTVSWAEGLPSHLVPIQQPSPGQRVIAAYIQDATPTHVQVVVGTPDSPHYLGRSQMGYGQLWDTRESNPSTCSHA